MQKKKIVLLLEVAIVALLWCVSYVLPERDVLSLADISGYYVKLDNDVGDIRVDMPSIKPGAYRVVTSFDLTGEAKIYYNVESSIEAEYKSVLSNAMRLDSSADYKESYFYVTIESNKFDFHMNFISGAELENLHELVIYSTSAGYRILALILLAVFLFIDAVVLVRRKYIMNEISDKDVELFSVLFITIVIASYPVLLDYVPDNGKANTLVNWLNGWLPVNVAYSCLVFLVNFITALSCFLLFHKLWFAIFYLLNPVRIHFLYMQNAIETILILMIIPCVFLIWDRVRALSGKEKKIISKIDIPDDNSMIIILELILSGIALFMVNEYAYTFTPYYIYSGEMLDHAYLDESVGLGWIGCIRKMAGTSIAACAIGIGLIVFMYILVYVLTKKSRIALVGSILYVFDPCRIWISNGGASELINIVKKLLHGTESVNISLDGYVLSDFLTGFSYRNGKPGFGLFTVMAILLGGYYCFVHSDRMSTRTRTMLILMIANMYMATRYFPWELVQRVSKITLNVVSALGKTSVFMIPASIFAILYVCSIFGDVVDGMHKEEKG